MYDATKRSYGAVCISFGIFNTSLFISFLVTVIYIKIVVLARFV